MKRYTLYAAFTGAGSPVFGVYDWNKKRLETWLADRKANGEAFDSEHIVRITVACYNRIVSVRGWPAVRVPNMSGQPTGAP